MRSSQPSGSREERLNFTIVKVMGWKGTYRRTDGAQKFGCPFIPYIPVFQIYFQRRHSLCENLNAMEKRNVWKGINKEN